MPGEPMSNYHDLLHFLADNEYALWSAECDGNADAQLEEEEINADGVVRIVTNQQQPRRRSIIPEFIRGWFQKIRQQFRRLKRTFCML